MSRQTDVEVESLGSERIEEWDSHRCRTVDEQMRGVGDESSAASTPIDEGGDSGDEADCQDGMRESAVDERPREGSGKQKVPVGCDPRGKSRERSVEEDSTERETHQSVSRYRNRNECAIGIYEHGTEFTGTKYKTDVRSGEK